LTLEEFKRKYVDKNLPAPYAMTIEKTDEILHKTYIVGYIDADDPSTSNLTRYANHPLQANALFKRNMSGKVKIKSTRDIEEGEVRIYLFIFFHLTL